MTFPKQWTPGEPITAERLNVAQTESLRSRRDIVLGQGSSAVFEAMGNQAANMRQPLTKLMIATEDFSIPDGRTDLSVGPDDVPSGLSKQVRLSRYDSVHREESTGFPERVWDVLGGLNGAGFRRCGEVFYAVFNQDSKRWEVLQNATIRLVPAIVVACLGDGWHEVRVSDWNESPDTTGSGDGEFEATQSDSASASVSASVSDSDPCDLCSLLEAEDLENDATACTSIQQVEVTRTTGSASGETVYAHTTRLMPMMVGGMIKMIKRQAASSSSCGSDSESASTSESGSDSVSDDIITDRLYDVVDGVWPLLALPFPDFECCIDPVTGAREVRIVSCTKAIVEGYSCDAGTNPCPEGSGSESA